MKEFWQGIVDFWSKLEQSARIGLIVGAAFILVAVLGLGIWTLRTEYRALFTDLDPRDAGLIVEELKRGKIPYRVEDNGSKILVAADSVHDTRLSLMSKGLSLSGGVGFEIFDNKDVGMTEYTQRINYQRALQGELARTIMAIEEIKLARVHLVVPETSIFKRNKVNAKASVSLNLKPGARMRPEQVQGIQRLVAAAVAGMDPGKVTVLDHNGVVLSAQIDSDEKVEAVTGKLRMKREVENYLSRKIADVLDKTFGPGQAIVSVDVALNFDEVRRTQEDVVPMMVDGKADAGAAVVRKRQTLQRQGNGPITKVTDGAADYAGASPQMTSTTEIEYELGKRVEQVVSTPGGIERLSVGVILPAGVEEEQLARTQEIVRMAAGYDQVRGDAVTIQSLDNLVKPAGAPEEAARTMAEKSAVGRDGSSEKQTWWTAIKGWLAGKGLNLDRHPYLLPVAGVLLAALIGILLGARLNRQSSARRSASAAALSEDERQRKLSEIQRWIDTEKRTAPGAGQA